MSGLSGVPTYTPETQKEKIELGLINAWPRIYRFINGITFSIIRIIKNAVISGIQQIFKW